jgi:hypothetical protein
MYLLNIAAPINTAPSVSDPQDMAMVAKPSPAGALDADAVQALERGGTLRISYHDGYTHRLRLEARVPPSTSHALKDVLGELARRPLDVLAEADVGNAEALVQAMAKTHGAPRAWLDEVEWLRWLIRPR